MARVLVIDDDGNLLQMLGLMLERAGHTPILASSGPEGIRIATQSPPDLAIVDVMMPGMSGHDVCRQLRAHPATVDMPILILTARAQAVDRAAALESGANDFMTKPVSPNELETKLGEILSRQGQTQRGRTITVFSLRGGVGVTTMSVNLAGALRSQQVPNITLVDLSPNSGHVALQMRVQPRRSWSSLLELSDPSTEEIRSLLISHPSGINLLAAPTNPVHGAGFTERQFNKIAETLAGRAKFLIIDAPPVLDPACIGALKAADLVLLVLTPEIATIQSTSATLRTLVQLGISGKKVHLLLNHPTAQAGLPKAAVERGLKRSVSFVVSHDPGQTRALAQGEPLSLGSGESPLPTAMQRVALALMKAT
jgi:pilus assembly protein CpaE